MKKAIIPHYAYSRIVGDMWSDCIKFAGGYFAQGALIGQAIGKTIANFCFSTDKVIQQFFILEAMTKFEDVIISSYHSLASKFKNYESAENADSYIQCIKMIYATYDLGCDYTSDFLTVAYDKGLVNTIQNALFGSKETIEQFRKNIQSIKNSISISQKLHVNLEGFRYYYEDDAPTAYKAYFEPEQSNAAYSDNVKPIYFVPTASASDGTSIFEYTVESDGFITITKANPSSWGELTIPQLIGGRLVRSIAANAFNGCAGITKVTLNNGLRTIGWHAFTGTGITSITIPKTVTNMGDSSDPCFEGATKLKTVIFEYGMLRIPSYAVKDCPSVTNVVIPNGVTEIGYQAFTYCTGLTDITIPDSVQTIGSNAFSGCTGLSSVTIPDSVITMGSHVFYGCTSITNVKLSANLKTIGANSFFDSQITTLKIPKTLATAGTYNGNSWSPFSGCQQLNTIIFENGIEEIPSYMLHNTYVKNVVIPNSVKKIGYNAFSSCVGLTDITIPDSVQTIGNNAFDGCTNLKKVYGVKNTAGHKFALENGLEFVGMSCAHSKTELVVDSVQSCETDGVSRYVCKICGVTVSTDRKPATGHNYSTEIVLVKATCQASGIKKVICSKCSDVTEQTIPALEHIVVTYGEAKAATCTKNGKTAGKHCSVCGTVITAQKTVKALGHKSKTTTQKATVSKDGKAVTACTACGKVSKTVVIYKASSVKLSKTAYTYNGKAQKPKVTVKNSKGKALVEGKDYTVKYQSGRKNPGQYTVTVTFKGEYSGKKTLAFTISPKAPTLKVKAGAKKATLLWNKQTGATGYTVYMATSKNGKYKKIATVKNGKVGYTKTGLKKGKTYYFKVAAYTSSGNKTVSGACSATKSVKVK